MFGSNDGFWVLPNILPVFASATTIVNQSNLYFSSDLLAACSRKNCILESIVKYTLLPFIAFTVTSFVPGILYPFKSFWYVVYPSVPDNTSFNSVSIPNSPVIFPSSSFLAYPSVYDVKSPFG